MINLHHHSKKEFQVERLVFFSDAVFAIAITLLIIEIKVPELEGVLPTEQHFVEALASLFPKFLGFVLSFFIIGLYWFIHHRMFGYVINYNRGLIMLNLLFLFSIVLMPFSTAVYSDYSSPEYIGLISPYVVYVFNICLTGVLNYLLWSYIGNPKHALTGSFPAGDFLKKAKIRSLLLPLVFILSLLTAIFIDPVIGRFVLFLTPVAMALVKNKDA
ncbi:TMEM175 family protein [Pontibacter chitinilyticus]|uniref:TMEM175 family protein n=1 Tax=Pontibacter chitinilyticus TaxID=2674989 RepID=UPI00321C0B90